MELLALVVFIWLFCGALKLAFRLGWGLLKLFVSLLLLAALPLFLCCLIFAGGLMLLVPLALVGLALGLAKLS